MHVWQSRNTRPMERPAKANRRLRCLVASLKSTMCCVPTQEHKPDCIVHTWGSSATARRSSRHSHPSLRRSSGDKALQTAWRHGGWLMKARGQIRLLGRSHTARTRAHTHITCTRTCRQATGTQLVKDQAQRQAVGSGRTVHKPLHQRTLQTACAKRQARCLCLSLHTNNSAPATNPDYATARPPATDTYDDPKVPRITLHCRMMHASPLPPTLHAQRAAAA